MSESSPTARPQASPSQGFAPVRAAHILDYWRIVIQRRAVAFTCLLAVVALIGLYTFMATPLYRSTTTLQIERQGPDVLTFKDVVGVDPMGYIDFYQTQFKILQSRTVLRLAAERLDLINRPELSERKGSPVGAVLGWVRGLVFGAPAGDADPLAPAIRFIEGGLSVEPVRNSHLVRISFTDPDPKFAAEIANAVAAGFQEFNVKARYSTTEQASEFLTKEVARVQAEVGAAERKLQQYGAEKEIVGVGEGVRDISEQALADLSSRLTEARGRLALAEARWRSVGSLGAESLPEVLNSQLINGLKEEYAAVERRYSQMAERFKPDWPPLQQLEEEMSQALTRLEAETETIASRVRSVAKAEYERARGEVAGLQEAVERQKQDVQHFNRENIEYASLREEIETKRKVLSDLVARRSQTETSQRLQDTQASNIRVVDAAEPPRAPVSPRKLVNLILALILGSGLGIGAALLLDYLDSTVKDEQDVQRVGGIAVLAHVPLYHPLRAVGEGESPSLTLDVVDAASHLDPKSLFAEAFRTLRTSFLLASPDRPPRTVVVTSFEPGDGKSTVCLNLGIVLTQMGKRVLVVDADLRRPRIHRMMRLANDVGLSSILSGNNSVEDAVQDTAIPGLHIVPSGPIPPNPSELLGSAALAVFLENVQDGQGFDHVLVDSPPSLQVSDGVILASKVDATIIVVRGGKTARESLAHGVRRVKQSRGHVAGAVLNAVSEGSGYYYYGKYGYYAHYGEEQPGARKRGTSRRLSARGRKAGRA